MAGLYSGDVTDYSLLEYPFLTSEMSSTPPLVERKFTGVTDNLLVRGFCLKEHYVVLGKTFLIRSERSLILLLLCLYVADPATLPASPSSEDLTIEILCWNLFSRITQCPFKIDRCWFIQKLFVLLLHTFYFFFLRNMCEVLGSHSAFLLRTSSWCLPLEHRRLHSNSKLYQHVVAVHPKIKSQSWKPAHIINVMWTCYCKYCQNVDITYMTRENLDIYAVCRNGEWRHFIMMRLFEEFPSTETVNLYIWVMEFN